MSFCKYRKRRQDKYQRNMRTTFHHGNVKKSKLRASTYRDLTGLKCGRLLVVGEVDSGVSTSSVWECKCDCGNVITVKATSIRTGHTQSCGCLRHDRMMQANTKHGGSLNGIKSREYMAWTAMKARCFSSGHKLFKHYGGRGITVCDRWLHSYQSFLDDMGKCPPSFSLDRINNDGNYGPENCRWASFTQQQNNKQNTRWITYNGKTQSLMSWCKELGFTYKALEYRIKHWPLDEAMSKPLNLPCSFANGNPRISRELIGKDKNYHKVYRYTLI